MVVTSQASSQSQLLTRGGGGAGGRRATIPMYVDCREIFYLSMAGAVGFLGLTKTMVVCKRKQKKNPTYFNCFMELRQAINYLLWHNAPKRHL